MSTTVDIVDIADDAGQAVATPDCCLPAEPDRREQLRMRLLQGACHGAAVLRAVAGRRVESPNILMYHRVVEPPAGLPAPTFNVPPARLRQQLLGLRRRGYEFWPLSRLLKHWERRGPTPNNAVVVTFDDGYQNMATCALPVLQELDVPATVFICPHYLDSDRPMPFDCWGIDYQSQAPSDSYRPLTTEQCRQLQHSGVFELGAHTDTHQDFRGRAADLQADLARCLQHLAAELDIERPTFAFPFGFFDAELMEAARSTGVRCALGTNACGVDFRREPFGWGRYNVFDWDSARTIEARLAGWYTWAPALKELVKSQLRALRILTLKKG